MDLLCFCSVLCLLCLCARLFICALWSPAGKGLTSWLSFVVSNCEFVTFLGRVRYLIVSIPDLCTLNYFSKFCSHKEKSLKLNQPFECLDIDPVQIRNVFERKTVIIFFVCLFDLSNFHPSQQSFSYLGTGLLGR